MSIAIFAASSMRVFHFAFVVAAILMSYCATAQSIPESVQLFRSGALDTVRISMTPLEKAQTYFEAVEYYTNESQYDSAFRALNKATRLVSIDTLLRNDVGGKLTMAKLELQRRSNASAARWAQAAFIDAQYNWSNDSLVLLSQQLQTIYAAAGQNDMAWRFRRFGDSLAYEAERAQTADSIAQAQFRQRETQQKVELLQQELKASNEEKERWFYYALVPLAAATLFLLIAVIVLIVRSTQRQPKKQKTSVAPIDKNQIVQRGATHTIAGYTDLLLQRGRTGDDLLTLKAMERELRRLRQSLITNEAPTVEIDDDRVMRSLKNISLLVVSDNTDASLLLKTWLRKRIRLCDIQELTSNENLPAEFLPDAILADIDNVTDANMQALLQLKQKFPNASFVVLSADTATFDPLNPASVLRKPFDQNLLLAALMKRYTPRAESPAATVERAVPYETEVKEKQPVALDVAIQYHCEKLEQAFPLDDHRALVESSKALDPLLQRAGVNATKWLEVIAEKPVGVTNLQTQLAFKNVVTYCRQAVAQLQQSKQP